MKTNQKGLQLIKSFEGLKLQAYLCPANVPTIGYGHTGPNIKLGMSITEATADLLLAQDLEKFETGVQSFLKVSVNENQFSSLVCFAYNCGLGNFQKSTLLKLINDGESQKAAEQFLRWNKAGGRILPGLTRRRNAERSLFLMSV